MADVTRIFDAIQQGDPKAAGELLAVNEALEKLAQHDPQKAELVKLRYFAGLTLEEAAAAIGISRATADRNWGYAKSWLYCELTRASKPTEL